MYNKIFYTGLMMNPLGGKKKREKNIYIRKRGLAIFKWFYGTVGVKSLNGRYGILFLRIVYFVYRMSLSG